MINKTRPIGQLGVTSSHQYLQRSHFQEKVFPQATFRTSATNVVLALFAVVLSH